MDHPKQLLQLAYVPVEELKPHPRNSRVHSPAQISRIAASLKAFGVIKPILVDAANTVIAGHGVLEAAKLGGITSVPTVRVEHLSADQVRAYIVADNKLAELSAWDRKVLGEEFRHLLTIEGAFDIALTGFEIPEIEVILGEQGDRDGGEEALALPRDYAPVSRAGDLWQLGKHRLFCGNSLLEETFRKLLGEERAAAVCIDPPFNVRIDGHATGKGRTKHREFAMASGEMTPAQFTRFLSKALNPLRTYSKSGSVHYVFMDWRHIDELRRAAGKVYSELLNLCIWVKGNAGMGAFYRSQHELVFVFRSGSARHRNNVQLGRFGRNRSNVWTYPGANSFTRQGEEGNLLSLHPTSKPMALVADAILDCTLPRELVLDSFLGSGTTLLAAERTGRRCAGIEIDPLYVDVAIRRWERLTGREAKHIATGKSFAELGRERGAAHG